MELSTIFLGIVVTLPGIILAIAAIAAVISDEWVEVELAKSANHLNRAHRAASLAEACDQHGQDALVFYTDMYRIAIAQVLAGSWKLFPILVIIIAKYLLKMLSRIFSH
jgi:hypothetical protein